MWQRHLAVNLTGTYHCTRAALGAMVTGHWGRIINIASIAGKTGAPYIAAYAASKHGVLGLTRTLALEVAKDGITVNAICPGPVRSRMNEIRTRYDAERQGLTFEEWEGRMNAIGRRLNPEEIVPMAVLLASDASAAITGQAYNICGGAVMS